MNKEALPAFMQRILNGCSALKFGVSASQPTTIQDQQNVNPDQWQGLLDKETLLALMQRILENGSDYKSRVSLRQLEKILEEQNADPKLVELISSTYRGIPEAKEIAKNRKLTKRALRIALRRAEERHRREAESARQGRC